VPGDIELKWSRERSRRFVNSGGLEMTCGSARQPVNDLTAILYGVILGENPGVPQAHENMILRIHAAFAESSVWHLNDDFFSGNSQQFNFYLGAGHMDSPHACTHAGTFALLTVDVQIIWPYK
jgi:hypothetical protein